MQKPFFYGQTFLLFLQLKVNDKNTVNKHVVILQCVDDNYNIPY